MGGSCVGFVKIFQRIHVYLINIFFRMKVFVLLFTTVTSFTGNVSRQKNQLFDRTVVDWILKSVMQVLLACWSLGSLATGDGRGSGVRRGLSG